MVLSLAIILLLRLAMFMFSALKTLIFPLNFLGHKKGSKMHCGSDQINFLQYVSIVVKINPY